MVNRVRLRFNKQGDLRLTSHRDLMRTVERLFRRAGVALCESEGFHPKPRVHYPASLALGMTGLDEVLEADLADDSIQPGDLLVRLNGHSVPGLEFTAAECLTIQGKKGQPRVLQFEVSLPNDRAAEIGDKVADFLAATMWISQRDKKPVDIRRLVEELSIVDGQLTMRLRVVNEAGARPRDVLEALGLSVDETLELDITRTHVEMAPS